ncbi:MAG: ABC transporter permease [Candidatus Omnitrophica bacterium]|nr:ABC transporter permease [Candidatus Omnitrophota bacterium]
MSNILTLAGGVFKEIERRKDIYLIFALLLIILAYSASLSFGGESNFQRYFKEIGISFTYIFSVIIAVTFASRQIPQETETKSIYHILARPVSRFEFIIGKFLGVFSVSAASFFIFYSVYGASLLLRKDAVPPILFAEGFILHVFLLAFFSALTILLSLFLSAASNAIISLVIYFGTNWFGATFPAYIYLPHPELLDIRDKIIHSWDIVPAWAMSLLALYALAYTALFLFLSYAVLRRRNL